MRAVLALMRKEWQEHQPVVFGMWALMALVLAVSLFQASKRAPTVIVAFSTLVWWFAPLLVLALVSRIVVREYRGRTQLFLESLPINRLQIVSVKWLMGLALLLIPVAASLAVTLLVAASKVDLTAHFIGPIVVRAFSFLVFIYALAFAVAFTGRYRYVAWIVMALTASRLYSFWQVPMHQWPPLHLMSPDMVMSREGWPMVELAITWMLIAVCVAITFFLALAGEGAVIVGLYGRMSHREKVTVFVILIAIIAPLAQLEERKPKPPYRLVGGLEYKLEDVYIAAQAHNQVQSQTPSNDVIETYSRPLAGDLLELKRRQMIVALPPVFLVTDASLAADLFQRADLEHSDGVVVRGALNSKKMVPDDFHPYTLAQVLEWHSYGRSTKEQRRWLSDGVSQWLVARRSAAQRDRLLLRSAVVSKLIDVNAATLTQWLNTREQLGECLSDALAWRLVSEIEQSLGEAGFSEFMQLMFGIRPKRDIRDLLNENQPAVELLRLKSLSYDQLAQQVSTVLHTDAKRLQEQLDAIELSHVIMQAQPISGNIFSIKYGIDDSPALRSTPFAVLYTTLQPWSAELPRASLSRVDALKPGTLPGSYERGHRIFSAVEIYDEQLACSVRMGAQRWEVK